MVEAQVHMSSVLLFVLLGKCPSIYCQDLRLVSPFWLRAFGHKSYLRAFTPWLVFSAYFCALVVAPDCITGFCRLPFLFCLLLPGLVLQGLHILLGFCRIPLDRVWSQFLASLLYCRRIQPAVPVLASYLASDWRICANIVLVLDLCAPFFCLLVGDTL